MTKKGRQKIDGQLLYFGGGGAPLGLRWHWTLKLQKNVCFVGKCDTFGEEIKLSRKRHMSGDPDEYTSGYGVKALSYCDLHVITLSDLMAVLDDYPEFAGDFLRQFVVTFSIQHEVRSVGSVGRTNYCTGLSSELRAVTDHNGPLSD